MRDEFWNLRVHEEGELAALVGGEILSREKLHHWPLSYVEKLILRDGRRLVYKAQHSAASVENRFYAKVQGDFLLEPVFLAAQDSWEALALPYVERPAGRFPQTAQALERAVGRWSAALQSLQDPPVYFDVSTPESFLALLEDVLGAFPKEEEGLRDSLRSWAEREVPCCYRDQPVGLLHGDLTEGNVITDGESLICLLDWQRPIRGPLSLESAMALQSAGFGTPEKPFGRLALVFLGMWYAYARRHLMPFPDLLETARDCFRRAGVLT